MSCTALRRFFSNALLQNLNIIFFFVLFLVFFLKDLTFYPKYNWWVFRIWNNRDCFHKNTNSFGVVFNFNFARITRFDWFFRFFWYGTTTWGWNSFKYKWSSSNIFKFKNSFTIRFKFNLTIIYSCNFKLNFCLFFLRKNKKKRWIML